MRVSIIITSHNRPDTLGWTVLSCLRQTHPDVEVIIVDSGSEENAHMAQSLSGFRCARHLTWGKMGHHHGDNGSSVKVIRRKGLSLSDARNLAVHCVTRACTACPGFEPTEAPNGWLVHKDPKLLPLCTGDALIFLDDDNWLEPTYVEKTVALLEDKVGIVTTDMHIFSSEKDIVTEGRIVTLDEMKTSNKIHSSSLMTREAFEKVKGYKNDMYEDWELWINVLKHGYQMAVVNEPLFHYRHTEGSLISRLGTRHEELIQNMRGAHADLVW